MKPEYALAAGAGLAIFVIALVFFTGSTFGQRCSRMYPADPIAAERCIYDLSKGLRP